MARPPRHREHHLIDRIGWLRAAVLGANDGLLSTGSLIMGVSSAAAPHGQIVLTGIAGLVAGAMSMAAGKYVSVSSQANTEKADLAKERQELAVNLPAEEHELAGIYVRRKLERISHARWRGSSWPRMRSELTRGTTRHFGSDGRQAVSAALASAASFTGRRRVAGSGGRRLSCQSCAAGCRWGFSARLGDARRTGSARGRGQHLPGL